jgi:hypothetical protein
MLVGKHLAHAVRIDLAEDGVDPSGPRAGTPRRCRRHPSRGLVTAGFDGRGGRGCRERAGDDDPCTGEGD